jgi:hypothetical protein
MRPERFYRLQRSRNAAPRRSRLRAIGVLLFLPFTACYRYAPVEPASVPPNEEVRVVVTDNAASRLFKEFGAFSGSLDGHYAQQGSDSVSVSVLIGRVYSGVALESTRQTLFLARSEVVEVQRRVLSRGRTALATAGVLAGFALLVNSVVQSGDPNPDDGEPPPPPPPGSIRGLRIHFR